MSPAPPLDSERFLRMAGFGVMAGIAPLVLIIAYDLTFRLGDGSLYWWQILVAPPLIAAASAPWTGPRDAAIIAFVGVPTAALATLALGLALIYVIPG